MNKNFVYLFCLLFMCSCISEPEEVTFISPDQEFKIDLNQSLSAEGPHVVFEITSVDHFSCNNVIIENALTVNDAFIELLIEKFKIDSGCVLNNTSPDSQVATGSSSILLDTATYPLTINIDELFHNSGTLVITETDFSLQISDPEGILIGNSTIKKVLKNHVWGSINIASSMLTDDEFLSGILDYVKLSEKMTKGNYGIFTIDGAKNIIFPNIASNDEVGFIFEIENLDGLSSYIQTVRQSFPAIELVVTLSTGEEL